MNNNINTIETKENITTVATQDKNKMQEQIVINYLNKLQDPFVTLTVEQVSKDLHIGINQAYELFRQNDFPAITIGKRKTVTLAAYLLWKINKRGVDNNASKR